MNDDLERFLIAQQSYYRIALQDIKADSILGNHIRVNRRSQKVHKFY